MRITILLVLALLACTDSKSASRRNKQKIIEKTVPSPALDQSIGETATNGLGIEVRPQLPGGMEWIDLYHRDVGGQPIGNVPAGAHTHVFRVSEHAFMVKGWNAYTDSKSVGWLRKEDTREGWLHKEGAKEYTFPCSQ